MTDDFDAFFRATYPGLVATGVSMGSSRAVSQELAQETLLRAYRRWSELQGYDSPAAWCRRVMANLLIDRHRSRTAEQGAVTALSSSASVDVDVHAVTDDPQSSVGSLRWDDLVAPLTERQRLAVTLHYGHDLRIDEVADAMDVAAGTVKSSLSKARRNVRRHLRQLDDRGRETSR